MIGNTHKKHLNIVLILALLLPFLTGCWDRTEIETRANILGIAIDVSEDNQQMHESEVNHMTGIFPEPNKKLIQITAQIAVPGRIPLGPESGSNGSQKPVWLVSTVGHTLDDAILNLQQEIADRLFSVICESLSSAMKLPAKVLAILTIICAEILKYAVLHG